MQCRVHKLMLAKVAVYTSCRVHGTWAQAVRTHCSVQRGHLAQHAITKYHTIGKRSKCVITDENFRKDYTRSQLIARLQKYGLLAY